MWQRIRSDAYMSACGIAHGRALDSARHILVYFVVGLTGADDEMALNWVFFVDVMYVLHHGFELGLWGWSWGRVWPEPGHNL